MIITLKQLKQHRACTNQVGLFEATFGAEVEVTREAVHKAYKAGLDLLWAVANLLSRTQREAYKTAEAPLWEAYETACAPLLEAYKTAEASQREAYNTAEAPLWEAYNTAEAPLWEAYETAEAPLLEAYKTAEAPLWEAYETACAPLLEAYETACAEAFYEVCSTTHREEKLI